MTKQTAYDKVQAARHPSKITADELINAIFEDFIELHGDRHNKDDEAIKAGIGSLNHQPVTIIATQKGTDTKENIDRHFGSPEPQGYRKALRLMKEAERFNRPVITFINTPGAYPGVDAEYNGQGDAIAQCLIEGAQLSVPYLSVIYGEGGSGGALALACGDQVWMFENSTYSVLSPEGYAAILWKDAKLVEQASEELKLTPEQLLKEAIIDKIVPEVQDVPSAQKLKDLLVAEIDKLQALSTEDLLNQRKQRFRKF
ncbi:acetyl-CoA carboxylase carboxyl transferase subunit alpha [Holzapfeliella sp. He02]|uniref:acetyl-CoA carboxytransferase n=1 Tax=Holzapfeliella saturejae TaxID=3082953 RepID=A0ABU8SHU2_9LACO